MKDKETKVFKFVETNLDFLKNNTSPALAEASCFNYYWAYLEIDDTNLKGTL